jgi:hypothetical protein
VEREDIQGFTDAEIRWFVKRYKKVSVPLKRLEAVALNAELQRKPLAELRMFGKTLRRLQTELFTQHLDKMNHVQMRSVHQRPAQMRAVEGNEHWL